MNRRFAWKAHAALALPVAAALLATSSSPAAAGQDQTPVFRSGVDLTRLKVAVLDENGLPVPGLQASDFRVFENGEEQRLDVVLAPADVPLDVAIVIDFSASVDMEWPDPHARDAAEQFLDALSPQDCVYLLPFQDDVGPGVWGAPDDEAIRRTLWSYPYGWSTRLYDAIRGAHAALDERAPDYSVMAPPPSASGGRCDRALGPDEVARRRAAVVVLSDGEDTASAIEYADVLLASHEAGRPVFAVAVGMAGGRPRRSRYLSFQAYRRDAGYGETLQDQLAELARVSGGHLVTQREIDDGYDEVLALLRGYYVLGYRTPEPASRGWQGVKVEVDGDYQVLGQPGVYRTPTDYGAVRGALRAASERMRNDPAGALRLLDVAAEMAPELASAAFGRGVALEQLDLLPGARRAYERALELSPGAVAVRQRLVDVLVRLGEHDAAWTQAIRMRRAGERTGPLFDRLRQVAPEPADLEARLEAPRVALPKPLTPDLEAQLALRPLRQQMGRILEDDPALAVVPFTRRTDFILRPEVRDFDTRPPRRLELRLELFDAVKGKEEKIDLEIADLDDAAAVDTALRNALDEAREWFRQRLDDR